MNVIDGKALAQQLRTSLARDIFQSGLHPTLAVLLVGDDPSSHLYVRLKEQAAQEAGIRTEIRRLPAETPDSTLQQTLEQWNQDPAVHAILVQLPLPEGHDTDKIIQTMDPRKDVDGFHPVNTSALAFGNGTIIPPVHEGILRLIAQTDITLPGTPSVIIGNSEVFTKPLAHLLQRAGSIVRILTPDELDRKTLLTSRILIVAVGRAGLIKSGMISPGTVIIDVGTSHTPDGKLVGDVDAESLKNVPGWLTPVPGGVGPMTIAMLLKNVFFLTTKN